MSDPDATSRENAPTTDGKPTCVVVLGMHRSGTSALAGTLSILGCDEPKTLMPASESNEKGYIESQKINRMLQRLLQSQGSRWDDWLPMPDGWLDGPRIAEFHASAVRLLGMEYGPSQLYVVKNPRICKLLPFWDRVWADVGVAPRFVLTHRNPVEVAASLQSRNNFDPHLAMLIWLRHVLEAEAETRGRPRSFTSYAELLQDWQHTAKKMQSDLGISFPHHSQDVTAEVAEFLSPTLRHFDEASDGSASGPSLFGWVKEAFDILERWVVTGEDPNDYVTFDGIRHAFDLAGPNFAHCVNPQPALSAQVPETRLAADLTDLTVKYNQAMASAKQSRAEVDEVRSICKRLRKHREVAETALAAQKEKAATELAQLQDRLAQTEALHREAEGKAE